MGEKNRIAYQCVKNNFVPISYLLILIIVYLIAEYNRLGDFRIFLDAGELLKGKENIYLYNHLNNFKYYYSPLFALFLSLFTKVNDVVIIILWKLLSFFFLFRIWIIINKRFIDVNIFSVRQKEIFQACVFLSCFIFISSCLHMAQMTIFLLYAIIEGLELILYKKKYFFGALLIAIAINIKIMPIIILPYLIYRNMFKPSIYIIIILLVLLAIPAFFIGIEYNIFLHIEWWKSINPFNPEHIIDINESGFHGLSALFSSLFTDALGNKYNLQLKRNILNLNYTTIFYILNITRLILILYTVRIMKSPPFCKSKSNMQTFYEISYILLITPLIFPHQQIYGFLFVIPAVVYIMYNCFIEIIKYKKINVKIILLICSVIIYNLVIILGFMKNILNHYKVLTYGVLLLLLVFLLYPLKNKSKILL